jgi:hypothetical protein
MEIYSISSLMADLKATNNGRLVELAMTGAQKRAAEKALERGLITRYFMRFPGFGEVAAYSLK